MTQTRSFDELTSGTALLQQRRFIEAISIFEKVLRREPRNIGAANLLGVAFMQVGKIEEAIQAIKKGLRVDNKQPSAHYNLGVILQTLGRHGEAAEHYRESIKQNPNDAQCYNNLGVVLKELGQLEQAVASYQQAIECNDKYIEAYANLGLLLLRLGRFKEAADVATIALSAAPSMMELHLVLGNALRSLGEPYKALESFDRAIKLQPNSAEPYCCAGDTMMTIHFEDRAIPHFERAVALDPKQARTHFKLATCLYVNQRYEEAQRRAESGFAQTAVNAEDEVAKAIYLQFANCNREALQHFEQGLKLDPTNSSARAGYGFSLFALGEHEDALRQFDEALRQNPEEREASIGKSLAALHLGRFREGWKAYDRRLFGDMEKVLPSDSKISRWSGESLSGKLLVWGEQGLGDQILYSGILSDVEKRVGSIILKVDKRLVDLMKRSFPRAEVYARVKGAEGADAAAHIPFGGLGEFFRLDWTDFHPQKYLIADKARAGELRQKIRRDEKAVVGLSWSSINAKFGEHKTARLADFSSLITAPELAFVNLQYGDTAAEVNAVSREFGAEIQNVAEVDNTQDIDGLAALIEACDAVVTTSNTTAHIAGALGKPVWIMVPHGQGRLWYWFHNRSDSPWYTGARIVHQQPGQSWPDVVASLAPEISEFARNLKAKR